MESRKDPLDFQRFDFSGYDSRSLNGLKDMRQRQHRRTLQDQPKMFTCHSSVPDIYKCEDCDFETTLKVSLTHHSNIYHKNLIHSQNQLIRYVLRQCGYCDFQTYSTLHLLKHCFKCCKRQDLKAREVLHYTIIKLLECGQCSYQAQKRNSLRNHIMKMHTSYKITECKICLKFGLNQHSAEFHSDSSKIVRYHCDKCKFKTKWPLSFKRHIASFHTDSANVVWYRCDSCEYKTKFKDNLKTHIVNKHTHSSKIRWNRCMKCEYKAKRKSDLRKHIANMHTDSASIAWYHCDKCEFKSKWNHSLKQHLSSAVHTDSGNAN